MRPGAVERLGIDYANIAAANPRIVYAAASGYRKDGPDRDRAAFDDVIQGESGLAAINGGSEGPPRYVPMVVCDKLCGYVLASSVGMALFHRERTGEGQEIHVPMLENMVAFNMVDHLWHGVFGEPEKGLGYPRMLTPWRRPYATADGHICLLATTDRQWRNLFAALDCPDWDELMLRVMKNPDDIFPALFSLVAQAGEADDSAAKEILFTSAIGLGSLALNVVNRLGMKEQEFRLVKCGGVFGHSRMLDGLLDSVIASGALRVKVSRIEMSPAVGAARIAARVAESSVQASSHGA